MEWGCMQALIDFDGWRKWKDFSQQNADDKDQPGKKTGLGIGAGAAGKKKKNRSSVGSAAVAGSSKMTIKEEVEVGGQ